MIDFILSEAGVFFLAQTALLGRDTQGHALRCELAAKTLQPRTSRKFSCVDEGGFNLIEILIVAGLVLVLVVFGSKFFRNKTAYVIKSETRKLSGLIQQTYNMAIATNQTRRLVINFDQASQDQHGTHWVEARSDPQSKFNKVDRFSKFTLPKEVKFKDVYFPSLEKKIETDQAFIHFFSQGQAEPAILHVEDVQKAIYSIKIHPLTGRATIHAGYEQ